MNTVALTGETRKIFGRKVKTLRREGIIPAHIFGHKIKTIHVQIPEKEFIKVEKEAGETGIVELKINSASHPVLIRATQVDPVTDQVLHVDFYQVDLKEKVTVRVPVEIAGESPAVESKQGILLTPMAEIEVEALPTELPESIKVDISKLAKVDDAILVKDLKLPSGIEILAEPEDTVVKIAELVTKEAEEILAEEAAERAEAVEEAKEVTEGEVEEKAEEAAPEAAEEQVEGQTPTGESQKKEE